MNRSEPPAPTLAEPLQAILDLFAGPLADLRFPDVDHEQLSESLAELERRRAVLQEALGEVQVAREELERAQQQLEGQARRAHAYATIYAEGDAALSEQLAAIDLAPKKRATKKRRRSKSKKASKNQTNLAVAEDAA